MSPQEKAEEIYYAYLGFVNDPLIAKQCLAFAIDNMQKEAYILSSADFDYWEEVRCAGDGIQIDYSWKSS